MAFQERNGTCGMKPERSGRNLAEKSGTDRDLKWDEICSVLFYLLNWYRMFRSFRTKRNGIDNLERARLLSSTRDSLLCFGLLKWAFEGERCRWRWLWRQLNMDFPFNLWRPCLDDPCLRMFYIVSFTHGGVVIMSTFLNFILSCSLWKIKLFMHREVSCMLYRGMERALAYCRVTRTTSISTLICWASWWRSTRVNEDRWWKICNSPSQSFYVISHGKI